jgi:hypothetical protein
LKETPSIKIDEKLEEINNNIMFLKDLILYTSTSLEIVAQNENKRDYLSESKPIIDNKVDKFLKKRVSSCDMRDWCAGHVDKVVSKVLHTYIKQGTQPASKKIKNYLKTANKYLEQKICDINCLENVVNVYKTLDNLIENSRKIPLKNNKNYNMRKNISDFKDFKEEEICNLLTPLSNATRLQILKTLGISGKNFAELERHLGRNGGHLQFHLNNLIQAEYITQEKPKGKYTISLKGIKVLRFLFELKENLIES